ncbi:MAG: tetratricopeptide repeat protein [Hyphomonadaceae bacterium]|nr:tetratricopeptide repeat protein [Hyphomonadaceae bacterium]
MNFRNVIITGLITQACVACAAIPKNGDGTSAKFDAAQSRLGYVQSKSQNVGFQKFEYQFSMDMTTTMKVEKENRQYLNLCKIYAGERIPAENMLETCKSAISAPGASQKTKTASYYNRGLINQKLDRLSDAREDFSAAVNLDNNFGDGYLALASLGMLDGDVVAARNYIETALTKKLRQPAYAHYLLGHALEADDNFIEARAEYRRALKLRPNWRDAMKRIDRIDISWPE